MQKIIWITSLLERGAQWSKTTRQSSKKTYFHHELRMNIFPDYPNKQMIQQRNFLPNGAGYTNCVPSSSFNMVNPYEYQHWGQYSGHQQYFNSATAHQNVGVRNLDISLGLVES